MVDQKTIPTPTPAIVPIITPIFTPTQTPIFTPTPTPVTTPVSVTTAIPTLIPTSIPVITPIARLPPPIPLPGFDLGSGGKGRAGRRGGKKFVNELIAGGELFSKFLGGDIRPKKTPKKSKKKSKRMKGKKEDPFMRFFLWKWIKKLML